MSKREQTRALQRENRELKQANEILRKASEYFCPDGARRARRLHRDK